MARIKDIHKIAPQPTKDGFWWFDITLDDGVTAKYFNTMEEPFKVGDEMPPYVIEQIQGKAGMQPMFKIIPKTPQQSPTEYRKSDDELIRSAKARACIDVMGYVQNTNDYEHMLAMVFEQLNKL